MDTIPWIEFLQKNATLNADCYFVANHRFEKGVNENRRVEIIFNRPVATRMDQGLGPPSPRVLENGKQFRRKLGSKLFLPPC